MARARCAESAPIASPSQDLSSRGRASGRALGWAEEHEKFEPLGYVVEGMMHPGGNEDNCAGTDLEVPAVSIRIDHHFRASAGDIVNLVL